MHNPDRPTRISLRDCVEPAVQDGRKVLQLSYIDETHAEPYPTSLSVDRAADAPTDTERDALVERLWNLQSQCKTLSRGKDGVWRLVKI